MIASSEQTWSFHESSSPEVLRWISHDMNFEWRFARMKTFSTQPSQTKLQRSLPTNTHSISRQQHGLSKNISIESQWKTVFEIFSHKQFAGEELLFQNNDNSISRHHHWTDHSRYYWRNNHTFSFRRSCFSYNRSRAMTSMTTMTSSRSIRFVIHSQSSCGICWMDNQSQSLIQSECPRQRFIMRHCSSIASHLWFTKHCQSSISLSNGMNRILLIK